MPFAISPYSHLGEEIEATFPGPKSLNYCTMSPNPVVLLINAVNVKKWFASRPAPGEKSRGRFEHRDDPLPGYYEYRPGRGLLLVAADENDGAKLDQPIPVIYCKLLHRNLLEPEYKSRQKNGSIVDETGNKKLGTFFRLDDGFTWIYWRDQYGKLDMSPRRRKFCIDTETGKFRPLMASDCIIDGQGFSCAGSSIRMSVGGDVHRQSTATSTSVSNPTTRPSSVRSSSAEEALRNLRTGSTASTPPSITTPSAVKVDGEDLDKRLRDLAVA